MNRTQTASASLIALLVAAAAPASAALLVTEVMYDPAGGNEHEYVELYNNGPAEVSLNGYVLGDFDFNQTTLSSGSVPAGGTAVLVRIDTARTLENYQNAWGSDINFVPTAFNTWPIFTNAGDTVTLYDDIADFNADAADSAGDAPQTFGRAVDVVPYLEDDFPDSNDSASIYLENVALDNADGGNWALSVVGVDGAYQASAPRASDVGSPGFVVVPEPATAGVMGAAAAGLLLRRRRK